MANHEPGDLVRYQSENTPEGVEYGFIQSVARDGDLHLKFAREAIRDENVVELVKRTGDPGLGREGVVDLISE